MHTCELLNDGPNGKCGLENVLDFFMGDLCLTFFLLVQIGDVLKKLSKNEKGEKEDWDVQGVGE